MNLIRLRHCHVGIKPRNLAKTPNHEVECVDIVIVNHDRPRTERTRSKRRRSNHSFGRVLGQLAHGIQVRRICHSRTVKFKLTRGAFHANIAPPWPSTQVAQGDGLQIRYSWVRIPPRPFSQRTPFSPQGGCGKEEYPPARAANHAPSPRPALDCRVRRVRGARFDWGRRGAEGRRAFRDSQAHLVCESVDWRGEVFDFSQDTSIAHLNGGGKDGFMVNRIGDIKLADAITLDSDHPRAIMDRIEWKRSQTRA